MQTKNKTAYFEWLRIFAAAAVVVMHTEGIWWPSMDHTLAQWRTLTFWDALVRWPVPVFIMITGAIFLPRTTELKTVLKRYIPRMAAAFLIWSGIYALYGLYRGAAAEQTLSDFLTGHYHLWYLPYLCGVYLMLPFVQRIVTDRRLGTQLLWVSLIVGAAIPWLADLAALCFPRWGKDLAGIKNTLHFTFFFDLLGVLLLGHELNRREQTPVQRRRLYLLGILGAVLTYPLTLWASGRSGSPNALFCAINAPGTLCTAAAIFVFAKYNLTRLPGAAARLAECSFGVYLIHALFIDVLADSGIHALAAEPWWTVPVLAAAVFVLSAAAAAVLRRLPIIGTYLA